MLAPLWRLSIAQRDFSRSGQEGLAPFDRFKAGGFLRSTLDFFFLHHPLLITSCGMQHGFRAGFMLLQESHRRR